MHFTIKQRLLFINLAALCFVAFVGAIGYAAIVRLDGAMDAVTINGASIKDQLQADQAHDALRADVLAAMLAVPGDGAAQQQAASDAAEHARLLTSMLTAMESHDSNAQLKQAMAAVRPDAVAYLAGVERMVKLAASDHAAAQLAYSGFMLDFRKLEKSMATLSSVIGADSDGARRDGDLVVDRSKLLIVAAMLLSMVATLVLGALVTRSILRPLDEAVRFAGAIADGQLGHDLNHRANDRSETGRLKLALNDMRASLHRIVSQVRANSEMMASAAGEIAVGNMDLSARTEMQASSLEETAASIEELNSTVRHNAENARQARQMAANAAQVAVKGGTVVDDVVRTMAAIDAAAYKIVDIIGVIESIAFQTNILALNAAVEAARAGEQGRGFAVVASEVRNLAQRANTAAREIKVLIAASSEQVDLGNALVSTAGQTMRDIVDSVGRLTEVTADISTASREQEEGIDQVSQAIVQIDGATQQNAALVEQSAAAAQSLEHMSAELTEAVRLFHLDGASVAAAGGTAAGLAPATALAPPARRLPSRRPAALSLA